MLPEQGTGGGGTPRSLFGNVGLMAAHSRLSARSVIEISTYTLILPTYDMRKSKISLMIGGLFGVAEREAPYLFFEETSRVRYAKNSQKLLVTKNAIVSMCYLRSFIPAVPLF